jgi:hypothetical protein
MAICSVGPPHLGSAALPSKPRWLLTCGEVATWHTLRVARMPLYLSVSVVEGNDTTEALKHRGSEPLPPDSD